MRAIQISEFGGPEVLKLVELPTPEPGPDEVLLRVTRAGINFADTHTRTNSYVRKASLPLVPGGEAAGVVVSAPPNSGLSEGQRVVALTGTGGYAEYALAPANTAFRFPTRSMMRRRWRSSSKGSRPGIYTAPLGVWPTARAWWCTPRRGASARLLSSSDDPWVPGA